VSVVLDTADLSAQDRMEAVYEAFARATVPVKVSFGKRTSPIVARIEAWTLGEASVLRVHAEDLSLERTAQQASSDCSQLVAVGFLFGRSGRWRIGDRFAAADQVNVADLTAPYELSWPGMGGAWALKMSSSQLDLSATVVRRGSSRLTASPLYDVVSDHIRRLGAHTDEVASEPAGSGVVAASVQLVRALIASAAEDDRGARDATNEARWPLIVAYVDAHLTESGLSPARIARANNISLRYLYKLCARHDVRLGEWIIDRRLRGAREDLERPSPRTVAEIARRWGFVDPAHFSQRFRHAFGMSPRQCRTLAHERRTRDAD
jgi:AraC-like DNA-binding protein